jgi:hypothetical protein
MAWCQTGRGAGEMVDRFTGAYVWLNSAANGQWRPFNP